MGEHLTLDTYSCSRNSSLTVPVDVFCLPLPLIRPHAHPPLPHPHEEVLQTEDTEEDTHEGSGYTGEDRPVLVLAPDWVCAI